MEQLNQNEKKKKLKMKHLKFLLVIFMWKRFKEYPYVEIESNKGLENEEEIMKINLQKLHVLKIKWKLHVRNALY
jgi:hypothetical protein